MVKDVLKEAEGHMRKSVEVLEQDLKGIRTGRASPALIERLQVMYYGTPTMLEQLATISAPEPQMLMIRPYDPGSLKDIKRDPGFRARPHPPQRRQAHPSTHPAPD